MLYVTYQLHLTSHATLETSPKQHRESGNMQHGQLAVTHRTWTHISISKPQL